MSKINEIELDPAGSRAYNDLLRQISQNQDWNNYLDEVRRNNQSDSALAQASTNGDQMDWQ